MSGWGLAGLAAIAFGPATANVDPRSNQTSVPNPAPKLAAAQAVTSSAAAVQYRPTGFEAYKIWLVGRARRAGIREAAVRYIPGLQLKPRVMELDRAQQPRASTGSFAPFAPYRREHVSSVLINRGQSRYSAHWPRLYQIQTRYGVDPAVLMAIYGHETSYGSVTGGFDLLDALATLGYEGRRRDYFETEFLAALKLIDQGIPRRRLKGSYAGATGYPQFMPTVALRLRADGDGDGYADLWANEDDAFASIANYLRDAGWKANVPWGTAVRTPATLNRTAIRSRLTAQRCPRVFQRHSRWMTVAEWRSLGVVPIGQTRLRDSELTALIEPDGANATAYLLSNNYRVILDYNCSNYYALSVGLLADAIARR
jgi:membrane-bound lytic murein transglycosylase B